MIVLSLAGLLLLAACASPALRQDCLTRQEKVKQVAAIADAKLSKGLSTQQVRALLGEPDEIITGKGVGDFDIWRYYVYPDCLAHLGIQAPETKLFFINGYLLSWQTFTNH